MDWKLTAFNKMCVCWCRVWVGIRDSENTRWMKGEAPWEIENRKERERDLNRELQVVLMKRKNESWT